MSDLRRIQPDNGYADELRTIVEASRRIVFFGGAGVSTESGIPDFRSGTGLYSRMTGTSFSPEEILSHDFFVRHTAEFYDYYRSHLVHPDARPNAAHRGLAALERMGTLTAVITQNIDGLHQTAGSRRVLELHGSVHRNSCQSCRRGYGLDAIMSTPGIPRCQACGGLLKPDVVLFGELLDETVLAEAVAAVKAADTLIVGGTSLVVYPAAGLVDVFQGDHLILINKQTTDVDRLATLAIHQPIGEVMAAFADPHTPQEES